MNKTAYMGNTKLALIPLLPTLCVCENVDSNLYHLLRSTHGKFRTPRRLRLSQNLDIGLLIVLIGN